MLWNASNQICKDCSKGARESSKLHQLLIWETFDGVSIGQFGSWGLVECTCSKAWSIGEDTTLRLLHRSGLVSMVIEFTKVVASSLAGAVDPRLLFQFLHESLLTNWNRRLDHIVNILFTHEWLVATLELSLIERLGWAKIRRSLSSVLLVPLCLQIWLSTMSEVACTPTYLTHSLTLEAFPGILIPHTEEIRCGGPDQLWSTTSTSGWFCIASKCWLYHSGVIHVDTKSWWCYIGTWTWCDY